MLAAIGGDARRGARSVAREAVRGLASGHHSAHRSRRGRRPRDRVRRRAVDRDRPPLRAGAGAAGVGARPAVVVEADRPRRRIAVAPAALGAGGRRSRAGARAARRRRPDDPQLLEADGDSNRLRSRGRRDDAVDAAAGEIRGGAALARVPRRSRAPRIGHRRRDARPGSTAPCRSKAADRKRASWSKGSRCHSRGKRHRHPVPGGQPRLLPRDGDPAGPRTLVQRARRARQRPGSSSSTSRWRGSCSRTGIRSASASPSSSAHDPVNPDPIWREIVGVVAHVRHYGIASEPPFVQLYTPFDQLPLLFPGAPSDDVAVRADVAVDRGADRRDPPRGGADRSRHPGLRHPDDEDLHRARTPSSRAWA